MKTKEEFLELREPYYLNDVVTVKTALEAMQLYSDQQNKELRKSIDLLNKSNEAYSEENEHLTKEVELLKLESDIAFKKVDDKKAENTLLRELLEKRSKSCQCGQNSLPYSANYTIETCSRCGMPCKIDNELNPKP